MHDEAAPRGRRLNDWAGQSDDEEVAHFFLPPLARRRRADAELTRAWDETDFLALLPLGPVERRRPRRAPPRGGTTASELPPYKPAPGEFPQSSIRMKRPALACAGREESPR